MNPESPLYRMYEQSLGDEIDKLEFDQRMETALNILEAGCERTRDNRTMLDSSQVKAALDRTLLSNKDDIAQAIYSDHIPTSAALSPPYERFEVRGVECGSYIAKLRADTSAWYTICRIVLATTAQKTLPDARGIYIARSTNHDVITLFQVSQSESRQGGKLIRIDEITDQKQRNYILQELEKAAEVVRSVPPPAQY